MLFNNGFKLPRHGTPSGAMRPDTPEDKSGFQSAGKNDALFESLKDVEGQVDSIVSYGSKHYIDGIKDNILRLIYDWFETDGKDDRYFFLFGNMGTGKSFFSSRLFHKASLELNAYPPVIYSSQQNYASTTSVEKMLLVVAHRLFLSVPEYADYCRNTELADKDIAKLVENVLVKPLENVPLAKRVLIVVDGLDEYPKDECTELLDALNLLRLRINPQIHIFFTSRPETYIRSHLPAHSPASEYTIESMSDTTHQDCLAFIRAKCAELSVSLSEEAESMLVEKSGFCLKYLKCVFDDVAANAIEIKDGTIDNLPVGLLSYYREQLIRYFTDDRAYREEFRPFLEIICAAYRPLKVTEAANILGVGTSYINNLILRAGTLIYKTDNVIYLYQSESIKPYLSDERYCPENYLVSPENGSRRILTYISELLDDEDLASSEYLVDFAPNHILDIAAENDNDAWELLFRLIDSTIGHRDLLDNTVRAVLSKPQKLWTKFIRKLYQTEIDPVACDHVASAMYSVASKMQLKVPLQEAVARISSSPDARYIAELYRSHIQKEESNHREAIEICRGLLSIVEESCEPDSTLQHVRYGFVYDEIQRMQRMNEAHFTEIIENLVLTYQHVMKSLDGTPKRSKTYPLVLRSYTVVLDQLGRTFKNYETAYLSSKEANQIAQALCPLIGTDTNGAELNGFFIRQAIICHEKALDICKQLQAMDPDSKFRLYDLHYSLLELARLHESKHNSRRNVERAIGYLEDCLRIMEQLANSAAQEAPSPVQERYMSAPMYPCNELIRIYRGEGDPDRALEYVLRKRKQCEAVHATYTNASTLQAILTTYTQEADIIREKDGIKAAEATYLDVARRYKEAIEKWGDAFLYVSCGSVYDTMAKWFSEINEHASAITYRQNSLEIDTALFQKFPSERHEYYVCLDSEALASEMTKSDDTDIQKQGVDLYLETIRSYMAIADKYPHEKYLRGPLSCQDALFEYWLNTKEYDLADQINADERILANALYDAYPNVRNAVSMVITNQHQAKLLIERDGPASSETTCAELVTACSALAEIWDDENVVCSSGIIHDYMAAAFSKIENFDKEAEYRRLSLDVDAKILQNRPSTKFESIYCSDYERYLNVLIKTSNPPSPEEIAQMQSDLAARYEALGMKMKKISHYRSAYFLHARVFRNRMKAFDFDRAAEAMTRMQSAVEQILQFEDPNVLNQLIAAESAELLGDLISARDGVGTATKAYCDAFEIAAKAALEANNISSIRTVLRISHRIRTELGDDPSFEDIQQLTREKMAFMVNILSHQLADEFRSTAERWFFEETVHHGVLLSKYLDDGSIFDSIYCFEQTLTLALSIVNRKEQDDAFWKILNSATHTMVGYLQMAKQQIESLRNDRAANRESLIVALHVALKCLPYVKAVLKDEDFKRDYGGLQTEYAVLLAQLDPAGEYDF